MNNNFQEALKSIPNELSERIYDEYLKLESRFSRQDWSPAELNGGRLAEMIFRYLEWKQTGSYTPISDQINRQGIYNSIFQDPSLPEGIRFHVLKSADLIFDFRNKRDVAHIGVDIDVDEMDSRLIMRMAAWIISEIIREESNLTPIESQKLIDQLTAEMYPLVEEIDGDLVVLANSLSAAEKLLIALYHEYPEPINFDDLRTSIDYANKSRFENEVIKDLQKEKLVHLKQGQAYLTKKGIAWIEQNIDMELEI